MVMKDRSLIDKIYPTFIALTVTAIHHCLLAWKTDQFSVPPEFSQGGAAQHKCDTRTINQMVDHTCTDVFRLLNMDFHSSSLEVQAKMIGNISNLFRQWIHSTAPDPVMTQPHHNQGSLDGDFFDYIPEELIDQPDNSFNCLSSFVAATEASM